MVDLKIKWIKVGDVIEVDGKKAKLKSIGEDFRYATLYTFKREDGSKFHWGHEDAYRYVMERHIEKLENLLNKEKQRADELEEKIDKNKRLHDAAIKSAGILFSDEKQRVDELQDLIERFLYANRESDVYAICSEEDLLSEYERIK